MSRFPIVLPNAHVRRIADRKATLLILSRRLPLGVYGAPELYEIRNQMVLTHNRRHEKNGRTDLQSDPHAFMIEISAVRESTLHGIDFRSARDAGFLTSEEWREAWCKHRRKWDPDRKLFAHSFVIVEQLYLSKQLHRNYTHDPAQGVVGEPAALTGGELARYASYAHARDGERAKSTLVEDRDQIARSLASMRSHLALEPDREIGRTVRQLEHQLSVLDRKMNGSVQ